MQGILTNVGKMITTAHRQVTIKRIACAIEEVKMLFGINMAGMAAVTLIKTIET